VNPCAAAWSTDVDVWVVPADGSAEPRCVTEENEAYDNQPSYSPDGGSLAWLAPMLGIDTVAVYANDRFLASHIFFATHVYRQNGAARFDTLDLRGVMDLDLTEASESMVAASRPQ